MSEWEFFATRLNGKGEETYLTELPLSGESIINVLSGADTIQGTLSPEIAHLRVNGEIVLEPWATAIYAQNSGAIMGGAIVRGITLNGPDLALDAVGFADYPTEQPYDGERRFVKTDSLDIVRHIWNHLQAQPNGNLGMTLDPLKSGYTIGKVLEDVELRTGLDEDIYYEVGPLLMAWWLTDDLQKVITDLAEESPFDYKERHWWEEGKIRHHLDFGSPTLGRRRSDLTFTVGENVIFTPSITRNGDEYASEVWTLGSGEGRAMRRGSAARFRENRLRRVAVVADKQARTQRAAATRATQELAWRTGYDEIGEIVLRGWEGDWPDLGDEIYVQGAREGWGGDLGLWVRVLSRSYSPSSGSDLQMAVQSTDKVTT